MTSWPCDERWVDNLWGTLSTFLAPSSLSFPPSQFWIKTSNSSTSERSSSVIRKYYSDDGAYWRYVYISMLLQYRGTLPKIFKILNVKIYKRTGDLYLFLRHAVNRNVVFFKLNRNTEFFNATSRYIVSILRKTSSWIQVEILLYSSCNIAEVFATLNQSLEFETETVSQQWCHDDTPTHFPYRMHKPHMNFE